MRQGGEDLIRWFGPKESPKAAKILIAIAGCHQNRARADAQRQTWVKDVGGRADVRFFAGMPHVGNPSTDEVWLRCADGYGDRKQKVIAIIEWAVKEEYDYLWKLDDDVYLRPERLLTLEPRDFYGAVAPYTSVCVGAIYGLSRASMEKLLSTDTQPFELHEDIWVTKRLRELGVAPTDLGWEGGHGQFRKTHDKGKRFGTFEPPQPSNDVIASWEHISLEQMLEIHQHFS